LSRGFVQYFFIIHIATAFQRTTITRTREQDRHARRRTRSISVTNEHCGQVGKHRVFIEGLAFFCRLAALQNSGATAWKDRLETDTSRQVDDTKVVFRQKQTTDDRNNEDVAKKSKEVAQKRGYSCKSLLIVATESIHNSDVRRKEGGQS
jgi:hypothetical protein